MVEFGGYLTEQNMLNYFTFMFNQEPTKISPLAIDKWKELPRMAFTHIQNTQIVAQRFDQKDKNFGIYDYYGQVRRASLPVIGKENGIGRKCWHNGGIEEGVFEDGHPNGYLREINADGSYFEGIWLKGERHGKGKEVNASGEV